MTELLLILGFLAVASAAMVGVIAEGIHASRHRALEQLEALAARYREGLARMAQAFMNVGISAAAAAEALTAFSRVTGTITFDDTFETQQGGYRQRVLQRYSQTPLSLGDAGRVVLAEDHATHTLTADRATAALAEEVPDA